MARIRLRCPACETDRWFEIGPWQTEDSYFGALSLICEICSRLSIHVLTKGQEITFVKEKT